MEMELTKPAATSISMFENPASGSQNRSKNSELIRAPAVQYVAEPTTESK